MSVDKPSVARVYSSINAITAELARSGIAKSQVSEEGGYRFRGIDDVVKALSPLLARHRLCILPRVVAREVHERHGANRSLLMSVSLRVAFDIVSARDGSVHSIEVHGEALDPGDKATAKAKLREGRCAASRVNDVWAMDFVHDQLATGPKLRVLTVVDTFSRFSPAVVPRFRFRAPDVIEVLERVCAEVGYPISIRVDQGSEFISRELDLWAYMKGVTLDFSRPGKPTDNAFIESFNGKFRAECLNQHWFMSLDDAVRKCEAWRRDYNEVRPHSAIGYKPPISLVLASAAHGPP